MVGCLTGSLVGGYQCDYLGRRRSMMLDCGLMVLGFLAISLAPGWELLLLGRLLTGHSSGSNLVATPIFTSEICEPSVRGAASVLTMVCYTSGFFLSMLAGAALPWRTAAAVFVVTAVASFVLLIFCKVCTRLPRSLKDCIQESPTWLLMKRSEEEAYDALYFYRGDSEVCRWECIIAFVSMVRNDIV